MPATTLAPAPAVVERPAVERDWIGWYGALEEPARRTLRDRMLYATYDEVKQDAELRTYFLFHSEDLADTMPPGSERLCELHGIVQLLRGAADPELQERRRKAVAFLLGEHQRFLRDNPWEC